MGKNKKKGMKMPARVEKPIVHAKKTENETVITHDENCTHWSTKKNCCKLGTVCNPSKCRARHSRTLKN